MIRFLLSLIITICVTAPMVFAAGLNAKQDVALQAKIDAFAANHWRDTETGFVSTTAPKIRQAFAKRMGMDLAELAAFVVQQRERALAATTLVSLGIDRENEFVSRTETGRNFVVIPATRELEMGDHQFGISFNIIAFEDTGNCYLMIISDGHTDYRQDLRTLREVYPDFESVPDTAFTKKLSRTNP